MSTKQITKRREELDSSYIHNYDQRLTRLHKRLESGLSAGNLKIVQDYDVDAITQTIGKATRIKHLEIILKMSNKMDKPWKEITAREIKCFIAEVMEKYSSKGDETWTTADFKKVVKIFFRWLYYGHRSSKVTYKKHKMMDSPITEDISISKVRNKLAREDLLTESEKSRLLHACGENLRDKAILSVKFEAGDRAGELMTTQIKHVKSDEFGAVIHVDGKTGPRPIRLIASAPDLFAWINAHPFRKNPDAPICMSLSPRHYGEPMKYHDVNRMLKRQCKKAEVEKKINFTLMRHSAITSTANYMTESQLKKRYGWTPGSTMPETYVHLVDSDVEDAILSHHGMKKEENNQQTRTPKICSICTTPNAWDSEMCTGCGKPLDLKTALAVDENKTREKEKLSNTINDLKNELATMKNFKEEMRQEFLDVIKGLPKQKQE